MKKLAAVIGLACLAYPLLRHLTFDQRLEGSKSVAGALSTVFGLSTGFTVGFVGLMILGCLVDGGKGYRKPALLVSMAAMGGLWCAFYPSGWFVGVPLIVYPLLHRFGFTTRANKK